MKCKPLFLSLALLLVLSSGYGQLASINKGVIDIRSVDLNHKRVILDGEWFYYPGELIDHHRSGHSQWIHFPQAWPKGQNYASYSLQLIALRGTKSLSIKLPQIYSSYQLFVNGELKGANGIIGKSKEESKPQWMPQTLSFQTDADTIEVTLAISNFHHHTGGVKESLYIGSSDLMYQHDRTSNVSNLSEALTLLVLAVFFFVIYLLYDQKKITIYFSLLCLSWAIRSVFSNQYLFIQYVPDFDWTLMVKIEYITLYFTMMWAILFLSRLFANEGNQVIKFIMVTAYCIFIGFTLFTEPIIFTRWLNIYLIFAGLLLIYGVVIVMRALANERIGAWYLTISVILGLLIFAYDLSTFKGIFDYNAILFSSAYILIFILMGLALLYFLNIIKSKSKSATILRYEDFYNDAK